MQEKAGGLYLRLTEKCELLTENRELPTENCQRLYLPPLAALSVKGRLSSITSSVPAGSIADLRFPSQ